MSIDVIKLAIKSGMDEAVSGLWYASDVNLARFAELHRALVLEEAAKEFDRRMVLDKLGFAVGFYEPDEPAGIIRALKP